MLRHGTERGLLSTNLRKWCGTQQSIFKFTTKFSPKCVYSKVLDSVSLLLSLNSHKRFVAYNNDLVDGSARKTNKTSKEFYNLMTE